MSLRSRLLLVYLIVVMLTVASVGIAVFELGHSRQIFNDLQYWNDIVINVQKLRTAFEREALVRLFPGEPFPAPKDSEFGALLREARGYLDIDLVRYKFNVLLDKYETWKKMPQRESLAMIGQIRQQLESINKQVEIELQLVNEAARNQDTRTRIMLITVAALTLLHVFVIGSLLRRWLLQPLQKLDRQVAALAQDRPPDEPLLQTPRELANLASELDRARQSLGEMRTQLVESERLTTIGQFAAQLAHNLSNPLASIRAQAQLAARQDQKCPGIVENMGQVIASVDRLNRWIAGLMDAARSQDMPSEPADVVPMLQRIRESLGREIEDKDLAFKIEAPQEGIRCAYNPAMVEQALIAMMVNAIEASPLGGQLHLRAECVDRGEPGRRMCRISVVDRGTGLPTDHPERIFEFSYSTKQRGMGLGLALARQALQRQGGAAGAFNNPEGGATVFVELPME